MNASLARLLAAVLLLSVAPGCAPRDTARLNYYRSLSPSAQELYDKYNQFLTESQQERFLAAATDEEREQMIADLKIEERLARFPQHVRDAIWSREAVAGMDREALLLSMGKPDSVERSTLDEAQGVQQEVWHYRRGPHGDQDHRVQLVEGVVTSVEKP